MKKGMKDIEELLKAKKIIKEHSSAQSLEEQFREKLDMLRDINLGSEALKQDHMDVMVEKMSDEEKEEMQHEIKKVSDSYSNLLSTVADALEDPKVRQQILEELKRRIG